MAVVLPDWCELVRGDGPVLLVAPHGGRRPRVDPTAPPPNLKVNDVHTADLTRELASRLGATAVINHGCDRNRLDLNRISQVRRRAPWFLELLRDEIDNALAKYLQVEVLFVHGWNVGQVKCDLGMGVKETERGLVTPNGGRRTVSRGYLDSRIAFLRAALEERSIDTFLGVRYPASHPNNFLQVFTDRDGEETHSQIEEQFAGWARAGAVQAVQLELGVPLRWPGMWRERLIACVVEEFRIHPVASSLGRRGGTSLGHEVPVRPEPVEGRTSNSQAATNPEKTGRSPFRRSTSLQFYDPIADLGLMSGIGPIGKDTVAARLLLFLGGQRVALFTGECTPPDKLTVEPLHFEIDGNVTTVRFAGPILHLEDGTEYLDLESAFAASTLSEIEVELRFVADAVDASDAAFGRIEGWVDLGDERRTVAAGAYANAASARSSLQDGHTVLAADFGEGCGLLANLGGARRSRAVEFREGQAREIEVAWAAPRIGSTFEMTLPEGAMRATAISRMEILRSLGHGQYARVTFGVAAVRSNEREGHGLYEVARLV